MLLEPGVNVTYSYQIRQLLSSRRTLILNPAVAFAQDAKTFGETACPQFLSITRKVIAGRRTHWAVIPAKAGIHAKKKHRHRICLTWVSACGETALRVDSRWISACRLASTAGCRLIPVR
jgi:hypothetical protein